MGFLIDLVDTAFRIYTYVLLARILLSWVQPNPYNPIVKWIYNVTEPVLAPARRLLPSVGMIDFSPILVFFILDIVRRLLIGLLYSFAY